MSSNADRNFIRFTRSSICIYPPVVKRFGLTANCSVHVLWNMLGHSWIFFTPVGFSKSRKLHKVNPDTTLYCGEYTDKAKRGDYEITDIDLLKLPSMPAANNEFHTIYKITKINEDEK